MKTPGGSASRLMIASVRTAEFELGEGAAVCVPWSWIVLHAKMKSVNLSICRREMRMKRT